MSYLSINNFEFAVSVVIEAILTDKRVDLLDELTDDYFGDLFVEEIRYIRSKFLTYGKLPSLKDFLVQFPNFNLYENTDGLLEDWVEYLRKYRIFNSFYDIYKKVDACVESGNIDKAMSLYYASFDKIAPTFNFKHGVAADMTSRIDLYRKTKEVEAVYIPLGLEGFDEQFGGFDSRGEDFVVFVARTGEGKTWLLLKMYLEAIKNGYTAGFYSPEMTIDKIGMRLDTWLGGVPFGQLVSGKLDEISEASYYALEEKWKDLKGSGYLFDKTTFSNRLTVPDLDRLIRKFKLDILFVDGFKYINDIRYRSRDSLSERMTNVAEDVMSLSIKHRIPIVVTIQSNRGGVDREMPALENIKDSDGVAHNATSVISIKNKYDELSGKTILSMQVLKSRDRFVKGVFQYEAKLFTFHYG